ncbi:hypothetical protein FXO37_17341 [Capsicum annuum]|nr:hypothetical protein FXO37_17341 [Capsicum annuum]
MNLQESLGGWLDEQTAKGPGFVQCKDVTLGPDSNHKSSSRFMRAGLLKSIEADHQPIPQQMWNQICFASFGNRVKKWITINEPLQTAVNGHCTGIHAPGRRESSSTEPFTISYWHMQKLFLSIGINLSVLYLQDEQGEEIGLVVDCEWPEALSDNLEDKAAAKGTLIFSLDGTSCYILVPVLVSQEFVLHLDPIYFGDYPKSMRERLGDRLPKFSQQERELLKDSLDFIGLNHYTSKFVGHATNSLEENDFYKIQDVEIIAEWGGGEVIGQKAASSWLYMVPWEIRKVLNHIAERYGNPPVYITENALQIMLRSLPSSFLFGGSNGPCMDDEDEDTSPLHEMLDDKLRVSYFKAYLASIHQAILPTFASTGMGANVRGYLAWSLLDNFEWNLGCTKHFGLIYVNFKNGLNRHLKSSAYWFMRFLKGGQIKHGKED